MFPLLTGTQIDFDPNIYYTNQTLNIEAGPIELIFALFTPCTWVNKSQCRKFSRVTSGKIFISRRFLKNVQKAYF